MRIAIISDIHGNSWALKSVLEDISKKSSDLIVNLGDILYGPLDPKGTYDLMLSQDIISISGNEDRIIVENQNNQNCKETIKYVINQLNNKALDWLIDLPKKLVLESGLFLCHGTPQSDTTYLLEDLKDNHVGIKRENELNELLSGINQRIILCGHSHKPKIVDLETKLIINPGSLGLPAYTDDEPVFHKMENHNNLAQYCLLDIDGNDIRVEQISISYDFEKAAASAESNKSIDWARWIRTGRA